jgi:cytochrome P450
MTDILGNPVFLAAVLLVLLVVYYLYKTFYQPYKYFDGLGIPGPPVVPVLGNLGLYWKHNGSFTAVQNHLTKKYGKVCRLYFGTTGGVLTSDLDMLKEIMIKQFDCFTEHQVGLSQYLNIEGEKVYTMDMEQGDAWRKRRRVLTPAFSAHKLKLTVPLLMESVERLLEVCSEKEETGELVDTYILFSNLTMEVILSAAFGCKVDIQTQNNGGEHTVYKAATDLMAYFNSENRLFVTLSMLSDVYPVVARLLRVMEKFDGNSSMPNILKASRAVMEKRKKELENGSANRKDLLQLLFEASKDGEKKLLTDGEMIADIMGILIAGYDTTSNTLAYTAYLLAINPEVQEVLANHILTYFEESPDKTTFDASNDIEYVGMVISEAQRIFPPIEFIDRKCVKPCTIGGVPFKPGMFTVIPIREIHHDPEVWPEPEKFIPERFTPEEKAKRHPCAYLPFGLGPRNCIGMRFALMEAKMALIEVVRNFKILRTPDTKVPLETSGLFITKPKPGAAVVKFQRREQ